MLTVEDFNYTLPEELIAQFPLQNRSASRLLVLNPNQQTISHQHFNQLLNLITPNDLLIFNNTKVIPARLFGRKSTGGKLECLVERIMPGNKVLAHLRSSHSPAVGSEVRLSDAVTAVVIGRKENLFELQIKGEIPVIDLLNQYGQMPLPPYIHRSPQEFDASRYQTVYAKNEGAIAAPTAGLHFDEALLATLGEKGVSMKEVTLHVGAGTFAPIKVDRIEDHVMHYEYAEVSQDVIDAIYKARNRGGRVIAVGTTVLRSLETCFARELATEGISSETCFARELATEAISSIKAVKPFQGETNLFITPGYEFKCVDALITNFHLPKSTLLMLVSAFGGYEFMRRAYQEAVENAYRFFSYGDAMFISCLWEGEAVNSRVTR